MGLPLFFKLLAVGRLHVLVFVEEVLTLDLVLFKFSLHLFAFSAHCGHQVVLVVLVLLQKTLVICLDLG